jgi:hypothetical protein
MKNLTDLNFITNIDDLTSQVKNSFPSIFTKDDVLKLLDALKLNDNYLIEDENKKVCGEQLAFTELIDAMQEDIKYAIENYEPELDEYSLSMEYNNEVVIDSHTADMKPLKNDVRDLLNNFREEFVKLISE